MPEEPKTETPQAPVNPVNPANPATSVDDKNGKADPAVEKALKDAEDYKSRVEPVLETILADPDLYKTVLNSHQKRLGVKVEPDKENKEDKPIEDKPVEPSPVETDNRNALVAQTVSKFESEVGLDKLEGDSKKEMNVKIGNVLGRMLDPTGRSGKTIAQLINETSLVVLPQALKDAYYLATREEREKAIAEKAISQFTQNESGVIGSIPSGSITSEDVTLTQSERKTAANMGISEEKYLARKKEILKNRNKIY